jgi:hypothetical protein
VQIATESPCIGIHDGILYALCDDGIVWYLHKDGWKQLPPIQQGVGPALEDAMSEPEAVAVFRDFTLRFPDTGDAPMRRAVLAHLDAITAERDQFASMLYDCEQERDALRARVDTRTEDTA